MFVEEENPWANNIVIGFMFRKSSSQIIGPPNVEHASLLVVEEVDSRFCSKLIVMLHFSGQMGAACGGKTI